jgi:hypothetical protein
MTKLGHQKMDSYRLAPYASHLPCYICGEENNRDGDLCNHCQAPMSLARQAITEKTPPQLTAVLGSAGTGKTVYLGMLTDMLSRPSDSLQILARGAFSISLQQTAIRALSQCEFPDKTPNEPDRWNWLHCQVHAPTIRHPLELIMPDMAGEAVLEEVEHMGTYPVITSFLSKCSSIMLLVDAAQMACGDQQQDFFARKIVSYLLELDNHRKTGWCQRPIAIVLTKADECSWCFDDPNDFAKKHSSSLWQLCQQRLSRYEFFATGVAGACANRMELDGHVQIPLRIEPRGIVEPFQWLVEQLPKKPKRARA